ncbi:MAG: signal recognition particle protein [Formosimonas sp.]|jgi:signal recognition particle subunit SRP54
MLDNLSSRFGKIVKTMRGQARLTEDNTTEMLREVRMAMLEADVALPVVREFIAKIKAKALGEEVVGSLTPGQALVGIVHNELVALIGGEYNARSVALNLNTTPPAIILMAGLQGAGKTTTVAKLAKILTEQKKKVLTVSCDIYRPAAIEQLKSVTAQAGAEFFPSSPDQKPADIAAAAVDYAKRHYIDVLLVDTAGRLGIDEAMMNEISALHTQLKPIETLFVVDAMAGQDAVNTAKAFNDTLPLTGIILTKLDGDSRGGAALSVRHVTGKPIKFVGMSEKINGLEAFHPDRMANRILGMGDIVSLVEEAQKNVDIDQAQALAKKIKSGKAFDLNDFKEQLQQMKKMGGVASLMDKLPSQMTQGAGNLDTDKAEMQLRRTEGIINAMTPLERAKPDLIKASRKRRIATGAGLHVQEVNKMLKQYEQMRDMMKKFQGGGMGKMMKMMGGMKGMKNMMGGGGKMPF